MKQVGDILRSERQRVGRTVTDVSTATKIREEYVIALEANDFTRLPAEIYIRGFVLNYARYLHLDTNKIMAFYRREQTGSPNRNNIQYVNKVQRPKLEITPVKLFGIVVSLVVFGFIIFLSLQYRQFSGTPLLLLDSPADNLVTTAKEIQVSGKTDETSRVSVNGQETDVVLGGNFSMYYTLSEGINKIRVIAVNRVGKKTTIERTIEQRNTFP